jgi:hypothetical protein
MVVLMESEVAWSSEGCGNSSELRLAMATTCPQREEEQEKG